ncbi:hypothetical protein U732_3586 [Clostridium argentinense CDC 2741]|uniref:Uncharacterized protein n=1 Tax=Clostridium argentinense CDC 2741 TaxID=1418104 RepID=A0A0C1RBW3_9CLOT|nr:hypothetical protein U732_3586 [Clostridium argentinense CDC 2741]
MIKINLYHLFFIFKLAFNPLIERYNRLLKYDDAEQDLIVKFIYILHKFPLQNISNNLQNGYMVSYINVTLKNKYICLSKNKKFYLMKTQN